MKKTILRIQGHKGGRAPVVDMMEKMVGAGIPFVIANSTRHTGSRRTLREWGGGCDLLYALVRQCDEALIRLLNTDCRIIEDAYCWHIATGQLVYKRGYVPFPKAEREAKIRFGIRMKQLEQENEKILSLHSR